MTDQPTPSPPLSPESLAVRQRIIDKLIAKGGGSPLCPVCQHRAFSVGPYVNLPVTVDPQVMALGQYLPCVSFACDNCGFTLLINLLNHFTPSELAGLTVNAIG